MNLYFIRHGQTVYNAGHIVQGWTDVDLTKKGRAQAAGAAKLVAPISFERIYASDLQRTKTTAGIIFGDADIIWDKRLREINNTPFAGLTSKEMLDRFGGDYDYARSHLDYGRLGAESSESLILRVGNFMASIASEYEGDTRKCSSKKFGNIAVVTHGGVIHAAIANVLGIGIDVRRISISNCSVSVFNYSEGYWKIMSLNHTADSIINPEAILY